MRWMSWPSSIGASTAPSMPGRVGDRRAHEVRRSRRDPRAHVHHLGQQRAVVVHHALGVARRARRVREHAHVVGSPRGPISAAGGRGASTTSHGDARAPRECGDASGRSHDDVQRQIGELTGCRAVDDVEIVDVAVAVGRDVRARATLPEDEAHLFGSVDVHDRHEHVAAHREAVERDDRLTPVRQLERDHVARFEPGVGEHGHQPQRVDVDVGVGAVPRPRLRPDVDRRIRRGAQRCDRRARRASRRSTTLRRGSARGAQPGRPAAAIARRAPSSAPGHRPSRAENQTSV